VKAAVDGQGVQGPQIFAAWVGKEFLRRGFPQVVGDFEAGLRKGHRLVRSQQGQVFILIPDACLDQDFLSGVGCGEFRLFQTPGG
jgi:hypothetical protein